MTFQRITLALLIVTACVVPSSAQPWVRTAVMPSSAQRELRDLAADCSKLHFFLPKDKPADVATCFWTDTNKDLFAANDSTGTPGAVSNTLEVYHAFFGPVRVGFAAAAAGSTGKSGSGDEDKDRTLALLRTNGGNLALAGHYPLLLHNGPRLQFGGNGVARVSANVSALGGANANNDSSIALDKLSSNAELSVETRSRIVSDDRASRIVLYTRTGAIFGSAIFQQTIGSRHSAFAIGEAGVMAYIGQVMTVEMSWDWYSDRGIPRSSGTLHIAFAK